MEDDKQPGGEPQYGGAKSQKDDLDFQVDS